MASSRTVKGFVLLVAAASLLLAMGCYNNNTGETNIESAIRITLPAFPETGPHAVLTFTEMHYQPSYRVQESPRLLPPSDSVPVTGREIMYTRDEYAVLTAPESVRNGYDAAKAAELYRVNCMVCHGASMTGDGAIVQFLSRGAPPPNLHSEAIRTASEGNVFAWISFGGQGGFALAMVNRPPAAIMPQFYQLLTEHERWMLVMYLKQQAAAQ